MKFLHFPPLFLLEAGRLLSWKPCAWSFLRIVLPLNSRELQATFKSANVSINVVIENLDAAVVMPHE